MKKNITRMKQLRASGLTYEAIGTIFGITRQRVHQLIPGEKPKKKPLSNSFAKWYNSLRHMVFERDNLQCQKCGTPSNICMHHIDGDHTNNNLSNLITLCNRCHTSINHTKLPKYYCIDK